MGPFLPLDSHPMVHIIGEVHWFPHQFLIVRENATKPFVLGEPGNFFPIAWVIFPPYDFHPTVYCIIWEMHGFPNQFPIVQENATKLIVRGEPGKSVLTLFPFYGQFISIRFPFYGILHHMGNACVFLLISHNLGKDSQNH